MMRLRAVISLLVQEVAGLRLDDPPEEGAAPTSTGDAELEALAGARRRAALIVALDWTALLVLFLLRRRGDEFLPLGPRVETVFTLGVLAVAIHSGVRLAQLLFLRSVERACRRLLDLVP